MRPPTHHLKRLAVAAAVLVTAVVAAGAARAGMAYTYADPAGDSGTAPDIRAVTLSDNGDGTVGFRIDLVPGISDDESGVVVLVDADRNPQTGSDGAEFAVVADAQGAGLARWDGSDWADFEHQPLSPDLDGGTLTFRLTLSDIGVTAFDFRVGAVRGDDVDLAPDGGGVFAYPPPSASASGSAEPAAPTIAGVVVRAHVLLPKAGKRFTVPAPQLRLSDDEVVAPDSYACTLRNHGRLVKPVAKCSWKLAKATKGKQLTLKLVVHYGGASRTLALSVTPR